MNPQTKQLTFTFGGIVTSVAALSVLYKIRNPTSVLHAEETAVEPPHFAWTHTTITGAFDSASIRRGYQVYREVCSSCHSLNRIAFRSLIGVCMTEKEAKVVAAQTQITDGPDEEGNDFQRPGKIADYHPSPYKNEAAARFSNAGALPPDFSLIVKGRPRHEDYVFSLLTGYREQPPPGVELREGLYYNPYFSGGAIGMAPPLMDGMLEFSDGTPATVSQMAKDVSTFLAWAAAPEQDFRKLAGWKVITGLTIFCTGLWYYKYFRFNVLKTRRIFWKK